MRHVEMVMRRRVVAAFINADPISVSFVRQTDTLVKTPAGGLVRSTSPQTLAPQRARIVHNTRRYTDPLVNSEAGEIPDSDYLLIGLHTLDVEVDDRFTWLSNSYIIRGIHPFREESKLCLVSFDGPPNREV